MATFERDPSVFANEGDRKAGEVPTYAEQVGDEDKLEAARLESQTTPSSIVQHRSEGPSTNGAPSATVPPQESDQTDVLAGGEEDEDEEVS